MGLKLLFHDCAWFLGQQEWLVALLREPVRFMYLNGLIPHIQGKLPPDVRIYSRHSLMGPGFNPFLSDLDLTVVAPTELRGLEAGMTILRMRQWLWMLDEPEIHTEEDEALWREAHSLAGEFIDKIWHIRKMNWTLKKQAKLSKSSGEFKKHARSLERSANVVGVMGSQGAFQLKNLNWPQGLFRPFSDEHDLCLVYPYLGFGQKETAVLEMSCKDLAEFIRIFPGETGQSENSRWNQVKRGITLHEIVLSMSADRLNQLKSRPKAYDQWIIGLKASLQGLDT